MQISTIALFGETEKGQFETVYYCQSLPQLAEYFGNPPPHSSGLHCAVQAILYHYDILFFRVREEGFSYNDYLIGLRLLETQDLFGDIIALCLPGVGDAKIIHVMTPFCLSHNSLLMTNEADLYDYLTTAH